MADCTGRNFTTEIDRTECIGNSLATINANFQNLDTEICGILNKDVPALPAIEVNSSFTVIDEYNDRTIVIDSANAVDITLTSDGITPGTQISFISLVPTGVIVRFVAGTGTSNVYSTPSDIFNRFAFQNSVATAYYWKNGKWFLFGDLIPV